LCTIKKDGRTVKQLQRKPDRGSHQCKRPEGRQRLEVLNELAKDVAECAGGDVEAGAEAHHDGRHGGGDPLQDVEQEGRLLVVAGRREEDQPGQPGGRIKEMYKQPRELCQGANGQRLSGKMQASLGSLTRIEWKDASIFGEFNTDW
jgi:hypothetical protein